jgi:DNA-directed RNA polymerase subunit M/transcription elongation factor TFIIS
MKILCSGCNSALNVKDRETKAKAVVRCPSCGELTRFKGRSVKPGEYSIIEDATLISKALRKSDATEQLVSGENYKPEYPIPPRMQLWMDIKSGKKKGEKFQLSKGRVIIGRAGSDLVLEDPGISRKHASIETWSRDQMFIRDLASTNGTFLNGSRITQTRVKDGDAIQVGNVKLIFHVLETEP